jgi:hypothetical protein
VTGIPVRSFECFGGSDVMHARYTTTAGVFERSCRITVQREHGTRNRTAHDKSFGGSSACGRSRILCATVPKVAATLCQASGDQQCSDVAAAVFRMVLLQRVPPAKQFPSMHGMLCSARTTCSSARGENMSTLSSASALVQVQCSSECRYVCTGRTVMIALMNK